MTCDICLGRGWVKGTTYPAEQCPLCGGPGKISWGRAAKLLGEDPATLARVRHGRSRQKTNLRVLDKVCALLWGDIR